MKENLIVQSKVKAYIKSKGFMFSGDSAEKLNDLVYKILDDGLERTKSNKRSTLRGLDL